MGRVQRRCLADFAVKAGLTAVITDYEPADGGPTDVYPQWLGVVGDKLRAKGVKIGAHVAAWGGDCYPTLTCPSVLHRYDVFAKAKVDIFASMDYEIIVGLWFLWFLDRKLALARCKPAVRGRAAARRREPTTQRPQAMSWAA